MPPLLPEASGIVWQRGNRCPVCEQSAWFPPSLDHIIDLIREGATNLPPIHLTLPLFDEVVERNATPIAKASDLPSIFGYSVCHGRVAPPPAVVQLGTALRQLRRVTREKEQATAEAQFYIGALRALREWLALKGIRIDEPTDAADATRDPLGRPPESDDHPQPA